MKNSKLLNIIKNGNIVIPLYLYKVKDLLKVNTDEFLFLMYLYNKGVEFIFNPNEIKEDLGLDIMVIMQYISVLGDKGLVLVEVKKNDKNVMEEYVNLNGLYSKLSYILMEEVNTEEINPVSIYELIEKEFARTLSPMEYEIIKAWLDNNISEELIKEALKEAVFNGVSNLRYIDKILYEWGKKGFKTGEDVNRNRIRHNEVKEGIKEVFEYNWLEDGEDDE